MAQDPEQMRARIEQQRNEITHTVDQIGNRVTPSHIVARRQDRMRRRLTDWREAVFGNDEPPQHGSDGGMRDRVGEAASSATSTVQEAPTAMRRQTRGNPMAAGAIALSAGWLIGGLLPETRRERRSLQRVESHLAEAASEVRDEARSLAEDLREPAKDAADQVKEAGGRAVDDVKGTAEQSTQNVREQSGS